MIFGIGTRAKPIHIDIAHCFLPSFIFFYYYAHITLQVPKKTTFKIPKTFFCCCYSNVNKKQAEKKRKKRLYGLWSFITFHLDCVVLVCREKSFSISTILKNINVSDLTRPSTDRHICDERL